MFKLSKLLVFIFILLISSISLHANESNATKALPSIISYLLSNSNTLPVFTSEEETSTPENQHTAMELNATGLAPLTFLRVDDNASSNNNYACSYDKNIALLEINATTGIVSFLQLPNYEECNIYEFNAMVIDGNDNNTIKAFKLNITNMLEFDSQLEVDVLENQSLAIELSTDSDSTNLNYIILNDNASDCNHTISGYFDINNSTGVVTFKKNPDYEACKTYEFTVKVTDENNNSTTESFKINLVDLAEFTSLEANASENQFFAMKLNATGGEGNLTYSILDSNASGTNCNTSGSLLELNTTTAVVMFKDAPNYEECNLYEFTAVVTDDNGDNNSANDTSTTEAFKLNIVNVPELKATNQTNNYGVQYSDGYYQKGLEHSYERNNTSEIVTDLVTNLQWADATYANTELKPFVTQANYDNGEYYDTSGDTSSAYCENLTQGKKSDWRLPTRVELLTIIDSSRVQPCVNDIFTNIVSATYWTSTTFSKKASTAWAGSLSKDGITTQSKYKKHRFICTREVVNGE